MTSEHDITLARTTDALAIAELSRDAIEYGLTWRWTVRRVMRCIHDADTNVVVMRRGGTGVPAFAIMQYGEQEAHVSLLAVHPGHRRQGLASALLTWLEATARVAGCTAIHLEVRITNPGAMAFYRRHGFGETGVSVGYYEGVEDAVRMVKPLSVSADAA
ncbi:N-acetyltransferase [Variovorax sp. OV329]|uniref:GNAT family N-acetyltransferase n=1 Tax=Variovorax sp. OV329 TaxID=1882825 RepID=UPI0008E40693|nr:GNAT family N-acetyltransferase [Variovorax sp. OV329]SFM06461.1 Acetyltransferase (GNAT) family protein [Variovorax sp. OV329]